MSIFNCFDKRKRDENDEIVFVFNDNTEFFESLHYHLEALKSQNVCIEAENNYWYKVLEFIDIDLNGLKIILKVIEVKNV